MIGIPEHPRAHVAERYRLAREGGRPEAWIALRDEASVVAELEAVCLRAEAGDRLPLAGVLLAVKGNIDVAGLDTTAG